MRIVLVGPFGMSPRGTMRVRALPMAKALASRGHQASMLLPPWQNPEDSGRQWEEEGVRVENIPLPPAIPGLFHAVTALRLARRVLALRPDVVHLFKPKAYSGLVHVLLSLLPVSRRPRLVVDTDDWEGHGGWNELADYTPIQRRFFRWQERWGLTHADTITVASRTLESLAWALGVPPDRVFYVPNGVTDWGRNRDHGCQAAACILLYTRFFEFPASRVIEIFQRVRKAVPRARLLIVGEGLHGEERVFLSSAASAGLQVERVSSCHDPKMTDETVDVAYAGWISPEALPSCFAQADVAIYPFDDTLVNRTKCAAKLGDLLAAGVPVVAEAVGENRQYIRSGETGLLVNPGDTAAFARSVVQLLDSPALARRLGNEAALDVRERFDWGRLVERVERAYRAGP